MNNQQGWIKLHRKICENPVWNLEPFSKGQAWVDMLLNANHKDGSFSIRGNIVNVKRGQLGWSELTMAKKWNWSRKKVRNFLKWLEKEHQIEQQKLFKLTSITTIVNYEQYQEDTTKGTTEDTTEEQQKNNRGYTNKNDKNDKNGRSIKKGKKEKAIKYTREHLDNGDITNILRESFEGVNISEEVERMKDWLDAEGKAKKDYLAFARNWIKRAGATKKEVWGEAKRVAPIFDISLVNKKDGK